LEKRQLQTPHIHFSNSIFEANTFIAQVNTQTMRIKSITHNGIAMLSLKTLQTLAGFEPGSSDPDAMSTVPRRQGKATYSFQK
jgi:hypothetical protein